MKRLKNIIVFLSCAAIAASAGFVFYSHEPVEAAESQSPQVIQAMPVEVTVMQPETVQIWKNFSGHVVAVDHAEIRPQVSGRITEIRFEDGQRIEKGDILVVIDPRPYKAALDQAKASLSAAKTEATLAEKELQRAKDLIKSEAVSQSLLDQRTNNLDVANASVAGAKAMVNTAEINLDYAYVKAPISGKTGRAEITEGNLVQAGGSAPLLTSIVADEKVYVDFEVDEQTYINSVRAQDTGADAHDGKIPVRLSLLGGSAKYDGIVHSFDNRIDPATGTIRARALFENSEKILLPGMSVTLQMGSNGHEGRILVSERAIGTDQDRKFVYVVDDDNNATYREIRIGESLNGRRIVLSGLDSGEQVITEGIVRIRPGMPVTPQVKTSEAQMDDTPLVQPVEAEAPE